MSRINDGGPAFPRDERHLGHNGMSLRDYFIAHAPAEPQPWFRPNMPPAPTRPVQPSDWSEEQRRQYRGWADDFLSEDDVTDGDVRSYIAEMLAHQQSAREWNIDRERQHYIQWPAAWADAMLRAREVQP